MHENLFDDNEASGLWAVVAWHECPSDVKRQHAVQSMCKHYSISTGFSLLNFGRVLSLF